MAMVVSNKSKLCMCSLVLLVLVGIGLAMVSTLKLLEPKGIHHVGTAEKFSQSKPTPRIVDIGAFQELKLYGSPSQAEVQCVNTFEEDRSSEIDEIDIDNFLVDQEEGDSEGSGRYGTIPPFPPPPPGLDGYPLRLRGEKGERGSRARYS